MTVFEVFAKSLFDRSLYRAAQKGEKIPFIGYLFFLVFVSAIVFSIQPLWGLFSDGQSQFNQVVAKAADMYPKELQVEMKSGKVSVNVPQPYYYNLPFSEDRGTNAKKHDVVIDTKTPFSSEQFEKYDTNAWLTEDALFMRDSDGVQLRTISLTEIPDGKLDKDVFAQLLQKLTPYAKYVIPVVAWFLVMGIVFWRMGLFIYLLFFSILAMIVLRFFGKKFGFGMTYRLSAYAVTYAVLLEIAQMVLKMNIPFLFTVATLIPLIFLVGLDNEGEPTSAKKK